TAAQMAIKRQRMPTPVKTQPPNAGLAFCERASVPRTALEKPMMNPIQIPKAKAKTTGITMDMLNDGFPLMEVERRSIAITYEVEDPTEKANQVEQQFESCNFRGVCRIATLAEVAGIVENPAGEDECGERGEGDVQSWNMEKRQDETAAKDNE